MLDFALFFEVSYSCLQFWVDNDSGSPFYLLAVDVKVRGFISAFTVAFSSSIEFLWGTKLRTPDVNFLTTCSPLLKLFSLLCTSFL